MAITGPQGDLSLPLLLRPCHVPVTTQCSNWEVGERGLSLPDTSGQEEKDTPQNHIQGKDKDGVKPLSGTALLGSRGPERALRLVREGPLFRHFMYCQLRAPPPPSPPSSVAQPLAFAQKDQGQVGSVLLLDDGAMRTW